MVKRPVLVDSNLNEQEILYPNKASLTLNLTGAHEVQLTLPEKTMGIGMHAWIKVWNQNGFVGYFRRTSATQSIPSDRTLIFKHGIDILQDSLWQEETTFSGTKAAFITAVLNHQTAMIKGVKPWVLGTCEDSGNISEKKISYNNLQDLLKELQDETGDYYFTYDQTVFPWRLNYIRKNDTPMSEFRLSRNLTRIRISENDAEMCTRLILSINQMQSGSDGTSQNQKTFRVYDNTSAQATYGLVTKTMDIDLADHPEGADAFAQRALAERCHPFLQIQADGYDLKAASGFDWDEQHLGRMCRVSLPEHDTWFTERVTTVKYTEFLGQPDVVQVSLANALPKLSNGISKMQSDASASAADARETEREVKETSSKAKVSLIKTEQHDDIFHQAGLVLDPTGVLIFAKDGLFDTKFSQIDVRADQISLKVGNLETGLASEIKVREDSITAVSKRIELIAETYVSINRLESDLANIDAQYSQNVNSMLFSGDRVSVNTVSTGALSVGNGGSAYWCSQTVVTGTNTDGTLATTTLHYLGSQS